MVLPCLKECERSVPEIILSLDESCFEATIEEPDLSDEDMEGDIAKFLGRHHAADLRLRSFLERYGDSREEIIKSMRGHVANCNKCRESYSRGLDDLAETDLSWARGRGIKDERTKSQAEEVLQKGYRQLVREYDVLGILEQNPPQ